MSARFTIQDVIAATNGDLVQQKSEEFVGVGTDTRKDLTGQIFVALQGENFDAHDFLPEAVRVGASLLIIHNKKKIEDIQEDVSIICVENTLIALQKLAHYWRQKNKFKVIAITGSNGKTTTKEFAHTILSSKFKCSKSPASFNNHWGVPISLLAVAEETDYAIIEMGMNHLGEIKTLCEIALPDIVLVTTVGSSHIGELGSQGAIVEAKKEIYQNSPNAIKIFNMDNEFTIEMRKSVEVTGERVYAFSSFDRNYDVFLRAEKMTLHSLNLSGQILGTEGEVKVSIFGRHNVNNLMAASAIAVACGLSGAEIWQQLPKCKSIWGRNELYTLPSGAEVLFDAYNANFESMSALVKSLFELESQGLRMAILGQMLELGDESVKLHKALGELVAQTGIDVVWFVGPDKEAFAQGMEIAGFSKNLYLSDSYEEKLAIELANMLNLRDVAVIKGSRGMKLERVLKTWQATKQ